MDVTVTNEFIHATTIIGIVDISVDLIFFVCVGIISPPIWPYNKLKSDKVKTSQELRMLSSVAINCQVAKIVINPGSQLSVL